MSIDKCRKYADKTEDDGRENEHRNWYRCPYTCDNTNHRMDAIKTKGIFFPSTQINRHTHKRARAHTIEEKRQFYAQSRETNKQNRRMEREESAREIKSQRETLKNRTKKKWKISNECVLFFSLFFCWTKGQNVISLFYMISYFPIGSSPHRNIWRFIFFLCHSIVSSSEHNRKVVRNSILRQV